mgnify:CR=1 FL=1
MRSKMLLLAALCLTGCGASARTSSQSLGCNDDPPLPNPPDAGYSCPPPGACEVGVSCTLCPHCWPTCTQSPPTLVISPVCP